MNRHQPSPWAWVPSLYFAQGLPYVVVMSVAVIMFKNLGMSNTDIALYTSGLYLPWTIKPLWSPLVDLLKHKRWWIVAMQLLVGAALGGIAMSIPGAPADFRLCMAFLWLLAFSSATHDIAADGFYMLALDGRKQAYFVGIRNTFYRLAVITGQGLVVMLAGRLEMCYKAGTDETVAVPQAWSVTFYLMTVLFFILFLYHHLILPRPEAEEDVIPRKAREVIRDFIDTFRSFFAKQGIAPALFFILMYRFAESQLVKISSPFLLDPAASGGLGLSTQEVGFIYGTIGVAALTLGGIAGGVTIARKGLGKCLWGMTAAMNLPNAVYLYLAFVRPENLTGISACITLEQFGYGYGFTSLTYFMMLFSDGKYRTAHYALCTGFMALGMMLPGMVSGWLQEQVGYKYFFIWIMLATLPSFLSTRYIRPLIEKRSAIR